MSLKLTRVRNRSTRDNAIRRYVIPLRFNHHHEAAQSVARVLYASAGDSNRHRITVRCVKTGRTKRRRKARRTGYAHMHRIAREARTEMVYVRIAVRRERFMIGTLVERGRNGPLREESAMEERHVHC